MANIKEIKSRIKSVQSTKKITKAMELISTVKMKKAQQSVLSVRPFAHSVLSLFAPLSEQLSDHAIFGEKPGAKKELHVVITSNKGLCAGNNISVLKEVALVKKSTTLPIDYITVGKKATDFIVRSGSNLVADFSADIKDSVNEVESKALSRFLYAQYESGEYSRVVVFYNYFVSAIAQKTIAKTLLPLSWDDTARFFAEVSAKETLQAVSAEMIIEPDATTVFDHALPLLLDGLFYEMILEAKASEHAARMVAMKNAKDNATEKVYSLTLSCNKARQAAITKEITEIVGGVESLAD